VKTTIPLLVLLLAVAATAQEAPTKPADAEKAPRKEDAAKEAAATEGDPTARFWEARRVMLAGRPKDAAELFRTILKAHPDADVADDCLYWAGRCWLRVDDREPDAVVAFKRLIETMPASPFVDDAARELRRLDDTTLVPLLAKRLAGPAAEAELAARALAELDDARGVEWLARERGEEKPPEPAAKDGAKKDAKPEDTEEASADEIEELRAEVKRLRKELDESLALLEKLLAEKGAEAAPAPEDGKKDGTSDTGSEKKK